MSHIEYSLAKSRFDFNIEHCCQAVKNSLFDRLIECGNDTNSHFAMKDSKRAYILSDEGLSATNKSLKSILVNMNLENAYRDSLEELGYDLEDIYQLDDKKRGHDAKSCANAPSSSSSSTRKLADLAESLVDSLATLELPAWGYGLRFKFGSLRQLKKGKPIHYDNSTLSASFRTQKTSTKTMFGMRAPTRDFAKNPLEIQRFDFAIMVRIGGQVIKEEIEQNGLKILKSKWVGGMIVKAMAYDSQNAGYNTFNTVSVRLWSALPIFGSDGKFHNEIANQLRYVRAISGTEHRFQDIIQIRKNCEKITCVPYPKDSSQPKKIQELVIQQQHFFMAATLKDILRRFLKKNAPHWDRLPDKVQLYLLDVQHAVGILELLRLLIDDHGLSFQQAFMITQRCFALQSQGTIEELSMNWNADLFRKTLPRHMELL